MKWLQFFVMFFAVAIVFAVGRPYVATDKVTNATLVCTQVMTYALNPETNECKEFSTPCDVPKNWKVVETCEKYESEEKDNKFEICIKNLLLRGAAEDEAKKVCEHASSMKFTKEEIYKCIAKLILINNDASYQELKKRCLQLALKPKTVKKILRIPKCRKDEKLEPITENGTIIAYKCLPINKEIIQCVKQHVKNMTYKNAIRKCRNLFFIKKVVPKLPEEELILRLKCLYVIPEAKKLVEEIQELKAEFKEKINEATTECVEKLKNINKEEKIRELKNECAEELKEINQEFKNKMKKIKESASKIYEEYEPLINETCVTRILHAREIVMHYKQEKDKILKNKNLTAKERYSLLKEMILNKTRELKARGRFKAAIIEGMREMLTDDEIRSIVVNTIKKDRDLIKDILKDPEIKQEIIDEITKNPEDIELLKQALEDKEAKIKLISKARKLKKLKHQLLRKDVVALILPIQARIKLENLNITNIDIEQMKNETIIKTEGIKKGRLFFLIPVKIPIIMKFKDEKIIEEHKPWWAFLVA